MRQRLLWELLVLFANERNIITWPSGGQRRRGAKCLALSRENVHVVLPWGHQSPRTEWRREGTCLWPCKCGPYSELLVYYYPRKLVITTGHLMDWSPKTGFSARTHAEEQKGSHTTAPTAPRRLNGRKAVTFIWAAISECWIYYPPATHGCAVSALSVGARNVRSSLFFPPKLYKKFWENN